MADKPLRIALVGAASLQGKALMDELGVSAFAAADLHLMDDDDAMGKLTSTGDEVSFVQRIEADSFDQCDLTFFAGDADITRKHWQQALRAGSSIVDLSGALEDMPGAMVRAPWISEEAATGQAATQVQIPNLQTHAVVSAHPVAVLLALIAARSQRVAPLRAMWTTLLQPASEYGHAALEELHQQTTNLLAFQPLKTEVFDGQTAFNLVVSFGAQGRVQLGTVAETIRSHYTSIASLPELSLALQIIQVPVFHGYALSIALEFEQPMSAAVLSRALGGMHVHIVPKIGDFPGNVQAVEEDDIQLLVQPVLRTKKDASSQATTQFWLWIVADNLKLAAKNAIACAAELNRLRPRGKVQ